jgi:hypothetical protein
MAVDVVPDVHVALTVKIENLRDVAENRRRAGPTKQFSIFEPRNIRVIRIFPEPRGACSNRGVKHMAAFENGGERGTHPKRGALSDCSIVIVDDIGIAANHVNIGMPIEVLDLSLKTRWVHEVIRVHPSDIVSPCELRDLIEAES